MTRGELAVMLMLTLSAACHVVAVVTHWGTS